MSYPPNSNPAPDSGFGGPAYSPYPPQGSGPDSPYGPPGPGPGSGPASHRPPGSDKVNGLAIASLITGLIGCISLVGAILGVIALRQIKERGERGRGLAIAGIVLFCVWVVLSVIGLALNPGSGASKTTGGLGAKPTPTVTTTHDVKVQKMRVGECINDGDVSEASKVKVVPCSRPHDSEVLAVFTLHGLILPSTEKLHALAKSGCEKRVQPRLDRDPAADKLAMSYYYPTAELWRSGDHGVTCLGVAASEGKKLTRRIHA
ncbi:DUF4190 domain-containing protein [Actinoallomurus sp. CA-150999]|uniref:DUF4190 domain-containing protein n=1 Tax=Actinoallomurus sp. CA-150999 TaxID=3239887 RepID=UPI003D9075AB